MKRSFLFLVAAMSYLPAPGSSAQAGTIAMPPAGPARVASADAVVVGKVEALEPQDVKVGSVTYRIAVVRINEGLRGVTREKTLRVGFTPIEKPRPGDFVSGARPLQLEPGQHGLFLLAKQAKGDFYTIGGVVGYFFNGERKADFDKEVQTAKLVAKVAEKPLQALQGKNADERLIAAAILIENYRTYRGSNSKLKPIDAQESAQILKTLADADWSAGLDFVSLRPSPGQLFQRLGVTAKDGFSPTAGMNYQAAAKAWLRANAGKYRIERFVAGAAK